MRIDFSTGKLDAVADHLRGGRRREFALLWIVLAIALVPYLILVWYRPLLGVCLILAAALFKVASTLLISSRTGSSHYIRFLLAGNNPIGMTGASSLLLGGVDAILDWREDLADRQRRGIKSLVLMFFKFLATPLGGLLMLLEFGWDRLILRRHKRLCRLKWNEFFSLAKFHDLICPEKSNDIFYADLAYARYADDPYLYQWHRLRAMVFELQHYRHDITDGLGVPETNLFRQNDIAAYQTLKRLQLEEIENELDDYYGSDMQRFPLPPKISAHMVKNARPLTHYLRFRGELWQHELSTDCQLTSDWSALIYPTEEAKKDYCGWHVLRLLDENTQSFDAKVTRHVDAKTLSAMEGHGVLESRGGGYQFSQSFRESLNAFLEKHFHATTAESEEQHLLTKLPTCLRWNNTLYTVNV